MLPAKRFPCCIMATCCVPWSDTWQFEEGIFRDHVQLILRHGTKHVYIFGTAGEGHAVSEGQFDRIADVFADEMRQGQAEPMVGVIHLSLQTIQERIRRLRDRGITLFQISLPAWAALNDRELFTFFAETCGRFPDCRFLHYNLLRTKRLVTPAEYGRLAAEFPNLVATKNSTDAALRIAGLLESAPQLQHFITETGFAHGSMLGECGLLVSVASINWRRARLLFDAARRRDLDVLGPLLRENQAITDAVLACVQGEAHIDGAFDKIFSKLHDPRFPLRLLPPFVATTDEQFASFRRFLAERYPAWLPDGA